MARPFKRGLDYFPCDVDMYRKAPLICIVGEFGSKGRSFTHELLGTVYRAEGYFARWSPALKYELLQVCSDVSSGLAEQIVARLVKWGFFDEGLFRSAKVLTSAAIQRTYFAAKRLKAGDVLDEGAYPFWLAELPAAPLKGGGRQPSHPCGAEAGVHERKTDSFYSENPLNKTKGKEILTLPQGSCGEWIEGFWAEKPVRLEALASQLGLSVAQCRELGREVAFDWDFGGKRPWDDAGDAARHLLSAMRVKSEIAKRNKPKTTSHGTNYDHKRGGVAGKAPGGRTAPSVGCGLID